MCICARGCGHLGMLKQNRYRERNLVFTGWKTFSSELLKAEAQAMIHAQSRSDFTLAEDTFKNQVESISYQFLISLSAPGSAAARCRPQFK